MKKFGTVHYEISTDKIKTPVRFCMLADLHGLSFGKENEELLAAIDACHPDAVLLAGDMIVRNDLTTLETAERFLKKIVNQYKVYYALGNHEYKIYTGEGRQRKYLEYEKRLKKAGIRFLHNEREKFTIRDNEFTISGLELPIEYYRKPRSPKLTLQTMEKLVGRRSPEGFQILLAHNPKYGKTYFQWGADLILSGHYHGGVVRLSKHVGLSSPQYLLFPPFCCGDFYKGKSCMLVSAGIGEHTVPIRIHNPREMLVIDIKTGGN